MVSLESVASSFPGSAGVGQYDVHSLSERGMSPVPLVSVTLSAATDLMKGNALDLTASYRSVGLNQNTAQLGYREITTAFSLTAPNLSALDFSKAIREKVEDCPEKLLDKLIIDGAVSLNYSW